jgi:hypothetical protein
MKDFTLTAYRQLLLALREAGYSFYTFEDWCDGKAQGRYVILRHDVDLKAANSLATARIEADLGIHASYYFRVVPQSNQPEIIRAIAALGHEVGYHYEDMSLFNGDAEKSIEHFKQQLAYFRQFYPVRTICMHGSPTSKWDNKELWKTYNYRDYGIVGEPYFDFLSSKPADKDLLNGSVTYLTDTARMWDGDKYNVRDKISGQLAVDREQLAVSSGQLAVNGNAHPKIHLTFDFIRWLEAKPANNVLMITTHPQRWTDSSLPWIKELFMQTLKNYVKRWIVK